VILESSSELGILSIRMHALDLLADVPLDAAQCVIADLARLAHIDHRSRSTVEPCGAGAGSASTALT
jgi:hypothetical protein